ncbi:ABC transporter permease (plasmid) [Rhizobium sp. WYJ-E13]|nr:ABC transporter permease [Rhizobium sp. WYJ-E13]
MPIDPALAIAGDHASASAVAAIREQLGLDQPLAWQFMSYLGKIGRGDFGSSVMTSRPVLEDLARFFPATFELATTALLIATAIAVPAGIWAALQQRSTWDRAFRAVCLIGQSFPAFFLGMLFLLFFYVRLGIAPGSGRSGVMFDGVVEPVTGLLMVDTLLERNWAAFLDSAAHIALPASLLAFMALSVLAPMIRAFILETLSTEYMTAALAKGLSPVQAVTRHGLPNVAGKLIAMIVIAYANLLEGALVTETLFSWPGIGKYLTTSLLNADMNAVLGTTLVIGLFYLALNRAADVCGALVDPRLR